MFETASYICNPKISLYLKKDQGQKILENIAVMLRKRWDTKFLFWICTCKISNALCSVSVLNGSTGKISKNQHGP